MTRLINPAASHDQQRAVLDEIIAEAERTGEWVNFQFGERSHRLGYAVKGRWGPLPSWFIGFNPDSVAISYQGSYAEIAGWDLPEDQKDTTRTLMLQDLARWSAMTP